MSAAAPRLDPALLLTDDPAQRVRRLLAEAWSLAAHHPAPPPPMPVGHGSPVLVIPAIFTGDVVMAGLRAYLRRCGFRAHGWRLGINWGPTPRILDGLLRRLDHLAADGPVGLVGVSLGGVLARNLAYERPDAISHVVTVCSPFVLPVPTTIAPLVRLCVPHYRGDVDLARLRQPLPVPSTMIRSRDDGIVAPAHCWAGQPGARSVEVGGAHLSVCRNPEVLRAIVEGLAGPATAQAAPGRLPAGCQS